ncbi:MAG: penicillin-binding protein 2 [Deltaproteobacteria bacterium]|nr:penicillin-binding protein 2 [Deltaproteobacteria bacterium]
MPLILDRHVPSPGVPEFQRRLRWLAAAVGVAFAILVGRSWQLQVVKGDRYLERSTDNFVKERWIPPIRGRILDREGVVLVDNRPSFNVYVTPRYYTPLAHANLIRLLGLSPSAAQEIKDKVDKARVKDRFHVVLVLEDIDRDRLALIEQSRTDLPGVDVEDVPHRHYPLGTLAAHVLGYMNQINETELEEKRGAGYEPGDYLGRYGIEKQWENYLRGKKGVERFVVDARGQRKSSKEAEALIDKERFVAPVPGHNVVLTLSVELQRLAERALRNHPAGGIAMVDVRSGKILVLVSKPGFDPNVMTGRLTRAEEAQLEADPYKPFLDKTLRQHYYPGSTYKVVTAVAALSDGVIGESDRVTCRGGHELGRRTFRCTKAHGQVSLLEAVAQSCNVYFWHLAQKVGMDRIADVAQDFGFGAPTGLGLNGDVPGRVPRKAWYEKQGGFRIGYTLNTAIGQGDTEVTVLQLALAYATLANGGHLWVPQIVERVETASGTEVASFPPKLRRKITVSDRVLRLIKNGLWGVVNDPKGTAFGARLESTTVAGKTGTAQVRKLQKMADGGWHPYQDHAWFAGFAPYEDPQVAIVVLVEHGGHGGQVAAPVAMEVIRGYMDMVGSRVASQAGAKGRP